MSHTRLTLAPKLSLDIEAWVRLLAIGPFLIAFPVNALEAARSFGLKVLFLPLLAMVAASAPAFLVALWFCSRRILRHGETAVEMEGQAAFRRRFLTPIFWKRAFRRTMGRRLNKNPFIWLEYRAAWARAARLAAVLILIGVESLMIVDNPTDLADAQIPFLGIVLVLIALKSSSSFQREKESGAFELILVTPFTESKLVAGRLRAVASYYFPLTATLTLFILLGLCMLDIGDFMHKIWPVLILFSLWLSIFSVPAAGLFFALRYKTFFPALLWTIGLGIIGAPILVGCSFSGILWIINQFDDDRGFHWHYNLRDLGWLPLLAIMAYHYILARKCRRSATDLLRRRAF